MKGLTDEELIQIVEAMIDKCMYGYGTGRETGGLLSSLRKPEPAKLPEALSRQLIRQKSRIKAKGREL